MYGDVTDNGAPQWYPGDADAGMIARQAFYMAVRYDGSDANTTNLELFAGHLPRLAGDKLSPLLSVPASFSPCQGVRPAKSLITALEFRF
jgi:hypothetical protein